LWSCREGIRGKEKGERDKSFGNQICCQSDGWISHGHGSEEEDKFVSAQSSTLICSFV
jgi:hypothetical protein